MKKKVVKYIIYIIIGIALGALMQLMPQLQGQWGQNIFTYMASDFGSWAVICILIATFAESPLHSGFQCFACMASMVAAYYIIVPETFIDNLLWVAVAILIFPIGIVTYRYKEKKWITIVLEVFLVGSLAIDVIKFIEMLDKDYQMVVKNAQGIAKLTDVTPFALGNFILLMAVTVFGMLYTLLKYRKENNKINDMVAS